MLKAAGCILIFIGCCTAGFIKAASYRDRRAELESVLELVRILNMEICYRKDSLKKIFERISSEKDCWFSSHLAECGRQLENQLSLSEAWSISLDKTKEFCPLLEKDKEILRDISMGLGRSDTGGQKKIFEAALLRLERNRAEAGEQEARQGKMYKGLGIAAGAAAAIILI
ncbi:MAG TPA: stage III sporulation protein AB [Candidatus Copromorpha excrementigallinarum]|uniref:Stage III sporulation protein AB n=1 Tax=Candidatus Allocopromorpha excrementigallinarum TaxID=2840742 RepID=A0A9D1L749_9FIRM|nr:stage III sporulation protein AB [Candidatus Copromorpha excrementigallinarum]